MKTLKFNYRKNQGQSSFTISLTRFCRIQRTRSFGVLPLILIIALSSVFASCKKDADETIVTQKETVDQPVDQYTITQAISDEAQRNTIAFDGLAYLTGNLGSQSFLPPGKVADYSGFQCLRDGLEFPTKPLM